MGKRKRKLISILFKIVPAILLAFFLLFCFSIITDFSLVVYADSSPQYGKIISSNVKLYRSTTGGEEASNIFFILPQTYFVELNPCENENFYSATYIDVVGYVKRNEIQCVKGTPQNPYANNISFRMFIPGGIDLRSTPTQSEGINTLATINFLETNLMYYGIIEGEEAISYRGTEWIFCKYKKNGTVQKGYIYSVFCDMLQTIPSNTEALEYISEPEFEVQQTSAPAGTNTGDALGSLPSATQIIIIVAVCLPCIFIIYLLFKPTKITSKVLGEKLSKKRSKKGKAIDYYEYDDDN